MLIKLIYNFNHYIFSYSMIILYFIFVNSWRVIKYDVSNLSAIIYQISYCFNVFIKQLINNSYTDTCYLRRIRI